MNLKYGLLPVSDKTSAMENQSIVILEVAAPEGLSAACHRKTPDGRSDMKMNRLFRHAPMESVRIV